MRAMEVPGPVPVSQLTLSEDDVDACIRVLRAIAADRSHLTRLPRDLRRELLTLAGLVAKPERHDLVRMAKAFRAPSDKRRRRTTGSSSSERCCARSGARRFTRR
jgi:hypothetical protein